MPVRRIRQAWFVDFYFGGERCRRRAPFNSEEGAIAYELFLKKECGIFGSISAALRANTPLHRIPCPTLERFIPRWFTRYVEVNNRSSEQRHKRTTFDRHLMPIFGKIRLCDIGLEEIDGYKAEKRRAGYSAKTINNHLAMLHRCLTCAKEWNVLRTEVPRVPVLRQCQSGFRVLNETECVQLLAAARPGIERAIVLTGLRTGMRFCELSALHWEDVDLSHQFVTVCRSAVDGAIGPPKNALSRSIPLTSDVTRVLERLPKTSAFVFPRDGRLFRYDEAWYVIDRISRDAGIAHVSWHDLRHTFASQLVERGASIVSVQKLLGHSDIRITMRYAHLAKDALRNVIALLDVVS
jgi:integrase